MKLRSDWSSFCSQTFGSRTEKRT